ncbi:hypothetical protein CCUS01_02615 [Colletotrichum cuscutae]|uniref:Uncharacterized protein n=1 Tax=Colletotrichum cuscutae TaxID=1209917 RepID=A0AAI9YDG5_9PEZI|nr:hypothetical protein CCUS01_02615 [Colletotrichum cuscutae]
MESMAPKISDTPEGDDIKKKWECIQGNGSMGKCDFTDEPRTRAEMLAHRNKHGPEHILLCARVVKNEIKKKTVGNSVSPSPSPYLRIAIIFLIEQLLRVRQCKRRSAKGLDSHRSIQTSHMERGQAVKRDAT